MKTMKAGNKTENKESRKEERKKEEKKKKHQDIKLKMRNFIFTKYLYEKAFVGCVELSWVEFSIFE